MGNLRLTVCGEFLSETGWKSVILSIFSGPTLVTITCSNALRVHTLTWLFLCKRQLGRRFLLNWFSQCLSRTSPFINVHHNLGDLLSTTWLLPFTFLGGSLMWFTPNEVLRSAPCLVALETPLFFFLWWGWKGHSAWVMLFLQYVDKDKGTVNCIRETPNRALIGPWWSLNVTLTLR